MLETAAANDATPFALTWLSYSESIIGAAFRQQEFELLDRVLAAIEAAVPDLARLHALNGAADVCLMLSELLDRPGFGVQRAESAVEENPYLKANKVWQAGLPAASTETMLDLGRRLSNDARIEGRPVAPLQFAKQELVRQLRTRETETDERYAGRTLEVLSSVREEADERGDSQSLAAVVGVGLLMADRQLWRGRRKMAQKAAVDSCAIFAQAMFGEGVPEKEKKALIDQLRKLFLRAVTMRQISIVEAAAPPLVAGLVDSVGTNDEALQDLLAVAGLAHLAAELDEDSRYTRAVAAALDTVLASKARFASAMLEHFGVGTVRRFLSINHASRYQMYLSHFLEEIDRLPKRAVREWGEIGYDREPDHPSELVRQVGRERTFGEELDECIASFLRGLLPSEKADEESGE